MDRANDTFAAEHLIAAAVLYDFGNDDLLPGQRITAAVRRRAEEKSGVNVAARAIAMVNYGWISRHRRMDSTAQWYVMNAPDMSAEACEFFRERGVKSVATNSVAGETAMIDGVPQNIPDHVKNWPSHDIVIIAMLRNLEQVSTRCLFVTTPLNIHERSGSEIRPVAYCPV